MSRSMRYCFFRERVAYFILFCNSQFPYPASQKYAWKVKAAKSCSLAKSKCDEVPEKVTPHQFRHSCAMHLCRSDMPLKPVGSGPNRSATARSGLTECPSGNGAARMVSQRPITTIVSDKYAKPARRLPWRNRFHRVLFLFRARSWFLPRKLPPPPPGQLQRYMEDSIYENAVNDDLREVHRMVEMLKVDSETTISCVRLMEKLERSRKKGKAIGKAEEPVTRVCKKMRLRQSYFFKKNLFI